MAVADAIAGGFALRSFSLGLLAGAFMLGAWALFYPGGGPFPAMYFAGGLIETILAGHFGDTWGGRAERGSS